MTINTGQLTLSEVAIALGVLVAAFGVLVWHAPGPVEIKFPIIGTITMKSAPRAGQWIVCLGVLVLIGSLVPLVSPASPAPIATSPPVPPAVPAPPVAPPNSPPSVTANVRITSPDGSSTLGRDVMASGVVGSARDSCRAVGWYVVTAGGWTGYFIKTMVHAGSGGLFRTQILQMGSAGETGSRWYPLLIGGSPGGCAWLNQLWTQVPTGEYHGTWPPPGVTVLYRAVTPVHRTS